MKVDRARFLALTATMAAGSCAPAEPSKVPGDDEPAVKVAAPLASYTPEVDLRAPDAPDVEAVPRYAPDGPSQLAQLCRGLKPGPGPHCESFEDTKWECENYDKSLDERVAEKAVACLADKSGRPQICDFSVASSCFMSALRFAPSVPSAGASCGPIVSQCSQWSSPPPITLAQCRAAASAVKPERRDMMLACMAEGCSIDGCLYSIR